MIDFKVADNVLAGMEYSLTGATRDGTAQINGGLVTGNSITFNSCIFQSLNASDLNGRGGSCLDVADSDTGSELILQSCLFQDNTTRGRGGAVFVENGWLVHVQNTQFIGNDSRLSASGGNIADMCGSASHVANFARK